ncbi:ABC transporter G family member 27 [Fragariocoptes setiger]|uniref:ABC transporter G family member 27 n=1 Tax=Fragariocoptes setiger TaxID=1670756 RepID=A0ABQ7S7D3_9ACAR|nr:ABC transporter G family member 27 [Fragariocoptes setiger]
MGPSGSGKTSLLSALSGRLKCSGKILLNGQAINKRLRRSICYVLQQDIFFPNLTLRQTLIYSALLRLPDCMSYKDKMHQVDYVIKALDLESCQHTIIGDYMRRGLSGGEKKRASIASELLSNPSVMFLDEPTSSLDSCSALSLMKLLKAYAIKERKTLVVTIHQPSSQLFHLFDKLLLLNRGQMAYFGPINQVVSHFAHLGWHMQPSFNPADFLIETIKSMDDQKLSHCVEAAHKYYHCQVSSETADTTLTTPDNHATMTDEQTKVSPLAEYVIRISELPDATNNTIGAKDDHHLQRFIREHSFDHEMLLQRLHSHQQIDFVEHQRVNEWPPSYERHSHILLMPPTCNNSNNNSSNMTNTSSNTSGNTKRSNCSSLQNNHTDCAQSRAHLSPVSNTNTSSPSSSAPATKSDKQHETCVTLTEQLIDDVHDKSRPDIALSITAPDTSLVLSANSNGPTSASASSASSMSPANGVQRVVSNHHQHQQQPNQTHYANDDDSGQSSWSEPDRCSLVSTFEPTSSVISSRHSTHYDDDELNLHHHHHHNNNNNHSSHNRQHTSASTGDILGRCSDVRGNKHHHHHHSNHHHHHHNHHHARRMSTGQRHCCHNLTSKGIAKDINNITRSTTNTDQTVSTTKQHQQQQTSQPDTTIDNNNGITPVANVTVDIVSGGDSGAEQRHLMIESTTMIESPHEAPVKVEYEDDDDDDDDDDNDNHFGTTDIHVNGDKSIAKKLTSSNASAAIKRRTKQRNNKWPTSFCTQLYALTSRNFIDGHARMLSKMNWIQTIGIGLIAGSIWFQVDRDEQNLSNIKGWMYFSTMYWMMFALFNAITSFPAEYQVINKERSAGSYRLSSYYIAKMIGELPLVIALPSAFHIITYPLLGFYSLSSFFMLWIFAVLNSVVAQSVGMFIGSTFNDLEVSITVAALYSTSTMLFGGFYSSTMPHWLSWLRYISVVYYGYLNMQLIEFGSGPPVLCAAKNTRFLSCQANMNSTSTTTPHTIDYNEILLGLDPMNPDEKPYPVWFNTMCLLIFFFIFRIAGYLVLRIHHKPN